MMTACLRASPLSRPARATLTTGRKLSRSGVVVRADNRPLREYREEDGTVSNTGGDATKAPKQQPGYLYADENPPPQRDTMSPEMKARLRKEYYSLGGSPNQAMGGNYFLNIILIVGLLAVLSKLFGYI